MAALSPTEIARDTLKLLASRRLPPTPENYQAIYEEVAGLLPKLPFPKPPLRRIASILPTQTPAQKRITHEFAAAVEAEDWTGLQSAIASFAKLDLGNSTLLPPPGPVTETVHVLPPALADQMARMMESTLAVLGDEDQRMHELTDQLATFLRTAPPPLPALEQMLHNYSYRLSFTAEDQAQRRQSMLAMLRMVAEHISAIAAQDQALQQQAQALTSAMQQPWSLAQLDTMQTHLKNLLFRHLQIEGARNDAYQQLKQLLGEHTSQLASLGKLSATHAQALQDCAQQIQQTQDLGSLAQVLESVVQSGHALATENRMAQAQLEDLRTQALAQERKIAELTDILTQFESSTRHDPLTGALNLQGLQETLQAEVARTQRHAQHVSLATLQLDPLAATDLPSQDLPPAELAALTHVARLVRSTLRPQDALGRVNDLQFAIVFPATDLGDAAQALARLQTELAQRPLLHAEHKLGLSFSAGLIAVRSSETPAEALARATQTCEQAQRMGRARVALS